MPSSSSGFVSTNLETLGVAPSNAFTRGNWTFVMSEPFRPYEKLVEITLLGNKFQVPERNSLLRCFQFISPETIPYGRFCWNQDCQYCRVTCQLPDDDDSREILACKFIVMPGMEITELSQELKWCLRAKLPQDETVIQP